MKKLTIYYNYGEGIGDTLISIYDIISISEFLKTNYPNVGVDLYINQTNRVGNTIEYMFDFETLSSYFTAITRTKNLDIQQGKLHINSEILQRVFSCNNPDTSNSIPGCFDIFCKEEDFEYFTSLPITFQSFILTMDSRSLPDYPILNKKVVKDVEEFVTSHLPEQFESIFYREFLTVDEKSLNSFIDKLLPNLDKTKTYFFCSNHVEVKKIFDSLDYNFIYFRPIDKHPIGRVPNGYSKYEEDMYYALGDMVILGKSTKVYTGISRAYVSLFNFYASSVHNVPIEYIQTI